MRKRYCAAITACSNGLPQKKEKEIEDLISLLKQDGCSVKTGDHLFETMDGISGSREEKARELMGFFMDREVRFIFDVSGGDMANEILSDLDYGKIKKSPALFWGYSDLTVILNAIYAKTGKASVLYQIRNLLYDHEEKQRRDFGNFVTKEIEDLFSLNGTFIKGSRMEGIVVGGNIRCFLKLAGTPYFPNLKGKILLLEARSGKIPQMVTYFSQLQQIGVFDEIAGLILGTFTQMEAARKDIVELALRYVKEGTPVFRTMEVGHGTDAKAVAIGGHVETMYGNQLKTKI